MTKVSLQDFTAMIVSLILATGMVALAFSTRDVPPALTMALGSAMTWLFIRTTSTKPPAGDTTTVESSGATETTVKPMGPSFMSLVAAEYEERYGTERGRSLYRNSGAALPWEGTVIGRWTRKE